LSAQLSLSFVTVMLNRYLAQDEYPLKQTNRSAYTCFTHSLACGGPKSWVIYVEIYSEV